jgi:hypothetical protein
MPNNSASLVSGERTSNLGKISLVSKIVAVPQTPNFHCSLTLAEAVFFRNVTSMVCEGLLYVDKKG